MVKHVVNIYFFLILFTFLVNLCEFSSYHKFLKCQSFTSKLTLIQRIFVGIYIEISYSDDDSYDFKRVEFDTQTVVLR